MPLKTPRRSTELLAHYRQINQQTFTIVDVETTGYAPPQSRVIEISVIQASLQDGVQVQQTSLINPGVPIPYKITQITGITQAMVDAAPSPDAVWPTFLPLLQTGILTAHNLAFDYPFLRAEFANLNQAFSRPATQQLCTVLLSRQLLPELPSRSLPDLVKHFGFDVGRSHRAAADTLACWLLLEKLLAQLQTIPDDVLLQRFAQQWLDLKDVAAILGCTQQQAQARLSQAGIQPRLVGRHKTPQYQRGAVEGVNGG